MAETLELVNEWLDFLFSYGAFWVYLAIGLACFIENIFPPFPGDTFIVVAGSLVALDRLGWPTAFLMVNGGGLLSVMILFTIGRRYGRDYFIQRNFKYFSVSDIRTAERRMERWGNWILAGSRFVVGFRVAIAVVAGISRLNPGRMLLFSALSYFAFTGLLMYIGYSLIENIDRIDQIFTQYNRIVWPTLAVLVLLWIYRRYKKSRRSAQGDG